MGIRTCETALINVITSVRFTNCLQIPVNKYCVTVTRADAVVPIDTLVELILVQSNSNNLRRTITSTLSKPPHRHIAGVARTQTAPDSCRRETSDVAQASEGPARPHIPDDAECIPRPDFNLSPCRISRTPHFKSPQQRRCRNPQRVLRHS